MSLGYFYWFIELSQTYSIGERLAKSHACGSELETRAVWVHSPSFYYCTCPPGRALLPGLLGLSLVFLLGLGVSLLLTWIVLVSDLLTKVKGTSDLVFSRPLLVAWHSEGPLGMLWREGTLNYKLPLYPYTQSRRLVASRGQVLEGSCLCMALPLTVPEKQPGFSMVALILIHSAPACATVKWL